jgi:hypothetical protein
MDATPQKNGLKPAWKPGQSGNPKGRPQGSRHRVSTAVENLIDGESEALTRKCIDMALNGDMGAMRLCIERLCPARKDRHVAFMLPKLETAQDAMKAVSAIAEAVAAGELTPLESGELSKVVDGFSRVFEAVTFEQRLTNLENKVASK